MPACPAHPHSPGCPHQEQGLSRPDHPHSPGCLQLEQVPAHPAHPHSPGRPHLEQVPARPDHPHSPQLEQGLCGGQVEPQDGPVGTILESLVLPSGRLEAELAGPVFYLLQALAGKGLGEGQGRGRDVSSSGWPLEALSPKVSPQC